MKFGTHRRKYNMLKYRDVGEKILKTQEPYFTLISIIVIF